MNIFKSFYGCWVSLAFLTLICCGQSKTMTSPYPSLTLTEAETWQIDGKPVEIENTNVLLYPDETCLFAITAHVDFDPGPKHEAFAKAIANYGLNYGYLYNTLGVRAKDKIVDIQPSIGVALYHKVGNVLVSSGKGFRFQFALSEFNKPLSSNSHETLQPYLGRWVMENPFVAFEFHADQTVKLEFRGETNQGRFAIDPNHEIPWLDLLWDNGQHTRVILALTNQGLKIQQSYENRGRPAGFTPDCAVLQRQPDEQKSP